LSSTFAHDYSPLVVADSSTATGLKWAAAAAGGKVLQVVSALYSTQTNSSSQTYADTGLTATITPSATNSKVLVLASCTVNKSAGNSLNRVALKLVRTSTDIAYITGDSTLANHYGLYTNTTMINNGGYSIGYLDSPNTTSATTYKIQFANAVAAAQVEFNPGNASSSLILMEIGA